MAVLNQEQNKTKEEYRKKEEWKIEIEYLEEENQRLEDTLGSAANDQSISVDYHLFFTFTL